MSLVESHKLAGAIDFKTTADEKKAVEWAVRRLQDIEDANLRRRKIALEHYKNYNSIVSKRFYNGRSDIFVPLSFMIVETMVAKIMRAIFAEPVPVFLRGVGPSDKDQEERIRALLNMQQKTQVKLWTKMLDYWRAKAIYGRGYAKMPWRTDYRKIIRPVLDTDELVVEEGGLSKPSVIKIKPEEMLLPSYDCWDFVPLDFFDMQVDPMAPDGDIQRANFVAQKQIVTDEDLRLMASRKDAEGKPFFDNFEEMLGKGDGEVDELIIAKKQSLGVNVSVMQELNRDGNHHELQEIWCDYDVDGDGFQEQNVPMYLLDRRRIIRAKAHNPFWHGRKPYVSGSWFRRPNEFLSQGLLDPIRRIQYEINDKRNQELDYVSLSLNATWLVEPDANIDASTLRVGQGGIIRTDAINSIKQIVYPDIIGIGQRVEAILDQNMRETTGVTRGVQGLETPGQQTATEFTQLLTQAGERIALVLESYGNEENGQLWEMAYSLNQQFLRKDTFVRLTEREGRELKLFRAEPVEGVEETEEAEERLAEGMVTPADLLMQLDFFSPSFRDIENENVRNRGLIQFIQIVQNMPPSEDNATFFTMLLEKLWVDVFKYPREELFDDTGRKLLLIQPGASSIFDVQTQNAGGGQEDLSQVPVNQGGEVQPNTGEFGPEDEAVALQQAQQSVPTGGVQ